LTLIHDEMAAALKRWVIASGAAPGATAYVGAFGRSGWRSAVAAVGARSTEDATPVTGETIYDLASLTKPVVAATAARLVRTRVVDWNAPLAGYLPVLAGSRSAATSLELLVSHRAGLLAHVRLRDTPGPRSAWLWRCAEGLRPECGAPTPPEGYPPVYSDLGYMLLGAALEAAAGSPLAELVRREVTGPHALSLQSSEGWSRDLGKPEFLRRVVPSERVPERGGVLWGVVHDDNAWDLAGESLAGHAGLFGTAAGVGAFGQLVVDALAGRGGDWLSAEQADFLVRPRPLGSLRAGFDGKSTEGSSAGPRFGAQAFGHLGFTGTSLWCDPDADIVVALLTNRVYPSRENIRIRDVRPAIHGELFGLAAGLRV
jgi:CubicO group peptidase (beta-lactamase class C family)